MISHDQPMAEVPSGRGKNITQEFERGFVGITHQGVTLADLEAARANVIARIVCQMPQARRRLRLSVEQGEPDWGLGLLDPGALPTVQWRLQNIRPLSHKRRLANVAGLSDTFAANHSR
jgi:hypothetical protein